MNLYEINANIMEAFEKAIDPETGEILDAEAVEELEGLQIQRDDKIENILLWIKNLNAEAEALKKEKLAFADRQARAEKKIESLKKYVSDALAGEKFKTDRVAVTWRRSESVGYTGDITALPAECIKVKTDVDKTALKNLLKSGVEIPGAEITEKLNIQIK